MTRFAPNTVWTAALVVFFAAVLWASVPAISVAGDNQPASGAAAAAPPTPPPAPANRPGFLHELASWWDGSIAYFSAKLKDVGGKVEDLGKTSNEAAKGAATATQQAMKNAVDASKDAASAVARLPNTRLIEMRERCGKAPNGAPDCAAAAANGCRAKGFAGGASLDVSTAENCPATTLLSGQKPAEGECPIETIVTRAVCQ